MFPNLLRKAKNGISLIVLIITVIVMLILAGSVIINMLKINTITGVNEAKFKHDLTGLAEQAKSSILDKSISDPTIENTVMQGDDLKDLLPDAIKSGYAGNEDPSEDKVFISDGDLIVDGDNTTDEEKDWTRDVGVRISTDPYIKTLTLIPDLTIIDATATLQDSYENDISSPKEYGDVYVTEYEFRIQGTDEWIKVPKSEDATGDDLRTAINSFTGLKPDTEYIIEVRVKYEVIDKEGNPQEYVSEIEEAIVRTKGATGELQIASTPTALTKNDVQVTITKKSQGKICYKIDNGTVIEDTGNSSEVIFTVPKNSKITAYLTNEGNKGKEITHSVTNIDKVVPETTNMVINAVPTMTSIKVQASGAKDVATTDYAASGLKGYMYSIDGTNYTDVMTGAYEFKDLEANTKYTIYYKACDNVGNVSEPLTEEVTTYGSTNDPNNPPPVDPGDPEPPEEDPTDPGKDTDGNDITDVYMVKISHTPTEWTKDNVTVKVYSQSVPYGYVVQYRYDGTNEWIDYKGEFEVDHNCNIYGRLYNKETGEVLGNMDSPHKVTNIDKNPPTVGTIVATHNSATGPNYTFSTWTKDTIYVKAVNGSDAESGHKTTYLDVTKDGKAFKNNVQSVVFDATGVYVITLYTYDNVGNMSSYSKEVWVDKTLPTFTKITKEVNWNKTNVIVTVVGASDNIKLADKPYSFTGISPDGASGEWISSPSRNYKKNQNDIVIRVKDHVGNIYSQTINITEIDETSPTVGSMVIKYNNENGADYPSTAPWTNQNIYLSKIDGYDEPNGSGHAKTSYTVRRSDGSVYNGLQDQTGANTLTESGRYTVTITTWDNAGHSSSATRYINIDKVAPESLIISASTTAWTNQNVTLTGSGIDKLSGTVYWQISTSSNLTANSGGWNSITATTSTVTKTYTETTQGTKTFYYYLKDQAGNVTRSSGVTIYIDKTAPQVSLTALKYNNSGGANYATTGPWTNQNVYHTFYATDSGGSGIADVFYNHDNTTAGVSFNGLGWNSMSVSGIGTNAVSVSYIINFEGTWTFYVRARDNAGNVSSSVTYKVSIDKTAPTKPKIKGGSTKWVASYYGRDISVKTASTDAASGLAYYQYGTSSTNNSANIDSVANIPVGTTSINISKLFDGYTFIRAVDNVGNVGAWSAAQQTRITAYNLSNYESGAVVKYDTIASGNTSDTLKDQSGDNHPGKLYGNAKFENYKITSATNSSDTKTVKAVHLDGSSSLIRVFSGSSAYTPTGEKITVEAVVLPERLKKDEYETNLVVSTFKSHTHGFGLGFSNNERMPYINFRLYGKTTGGSTYSSYVDAGRYEMKKVLTTIQGRANCYVEDNKLYAYVRMGWNEKYRESGQSGYQRGSVSTLTSGSGSALVIGGNPNDSTGLIENSTNNECLFKGYVFAFRYYNKVLEDDEFQRNAAIDNGRYWMYEPVLAVELSGA